MRFWLHLFCYYDNILNCRLKLLMYFNCHTFEKLFNKSRLITISNLKPITKKSISIENLLKF